MSLAGRAAQNASARIYCLSFMLHPGTTIYGDEISVNSTGGTTAGNDEMSPWGLPPGGDLMLLGPQTYSSGLNLYDGYYQYWSYGTITIYLPELTDTNNNRFPDFFEVSLPCSASSSGALSYFDPYLGDVNDTLAVTWSRAAGSKSGACQLTPGNAYWGTFTHAFEILEYTGTLSYTPGSNSITGSIALTQTGNSASTMAGPLNFVKSSDDHFNQLTNQPGVWTNASLRSMAFTNHPFTRDVGWPTNYAGYIEFDDDASFYTFYPFALWVLSINDTHDANHNGIPDFSDDPQPGAPPRRPLLSLTRSANNVWLTISGDTNHVHQVQESLVLPATNWQNVLSVTLTNDPQTVPLAVPGRTKFWRVQAQ
jgi:hypothetical protein